MKGGKNKQPLGYTLVEVMIVLAVSGVMFLIAASFINGKQQKAAFNSGVNEMASQIQDVIEQVTDGKYSDSPLNCTDIGGTISFPAGSSPQGTNQDCTFVGKFLSFGNGGSPNNFQIFSLAGSSQTNSLTGVTPIAAPFVSASSEDLTTNSVTPQGIDVKDILLNNSTHVNGFGFAIQSAGVANGAGQYSSGGQTIEMVYAPFLANPNAAASEIRSGGLTGANSIDVCMSDGTEYAEIILGGFDTSTGSSQSQLVVNVHQLETGTC